MKIPRHIESMAIRLSCVLLLLCQVLSSAPLPPLTCPAGGPIGSVDLRVSSPRRKHADPLPLRTINRVEEGDTILYKPLLHSGEQRKGDVAIVLTPADKTAAGEKLLVLEPKSAGAKQEWQVPWRVAVVAFVYGPAGLNAKRVRSFLTRDDDLVAQLADYAEKTAHTEALIAALSSPNYSSASMQSAIKGFSSQYGFGTQLDRNAPSEQQALMLFRSLNPAIANYDPISSQGAQQFTQTASIATSIAALFFGNPVGLAAGGTAMLMELRSVAFPRSEFRSSISQPMPGEGLGLCGKRDPSPPHTKVAYIWASRVPNMNPPKVSIDKASTLPPGAKSPLAVSIADPDWKGIDRARNWTMTPEKGAAVPVNVLKLGDTKILELDLGSNIAAGKYTLSADWDWERFAVTGNVDVRPLDTFLSAKVTASSQDKLMARTGKVELTLEGEDFEFLTKVEFDKVGDKFASPTAVPFVLPRGLRQGRQQRMEVQVNTGDLDPGEYALLLTQIDGKPHPMKLKILPAMPKVSNFPVILNQGSPGADYMLLGHGLNLLKRVELSDGKATLSDSKSDPSSRKLSLQLSPGLPKGASLTLKAYVEDRSEPIVFSGAVLISGPRPHLMDVTVSQPLEQPIQLEKDELPGGTYLSAMIRGRNFQPSGILKLSCEQGSAPVVAKVQQLSAEQLFLSFDTGAWMNGCILRASITNGNDGESDPIRLGRIVRVPVIEQFDEPQAADEGTQAVLVTLTGQSLETVEKLSWNPGSGEPVTSLPRPMSGNGQKQVLQLRMAPRPEAQSPLYAWLRGETKPRMVRLSK